MTFRHKSKRRAPVLGGVRAMLAHSDDGGGKGTKQAEKPYNNEQCLPHYKMVGTLLQDSRRMSKVGGLPDE